MSRSSNFELKILMESFPLTLRNGTGIYTYAINLLEAINFLDHTNVELLLLFEKQVKYRRGLRSKEPLINFRAYTQFLYDLYHQSPQGVSKSDFRFCFSNWQNVLSNYISVFTWLLKDINVIPIPDHFKSSLKEIISNNDSIDYDFIEKNLAYISSLSRPKLVFRNLLGINNAIKSQKFSSQYDVFHCTHLSPLVIPNLPRVTTIHDIIPLLRPELVVSESSLAFSKLLRLNINKSTNIIAVSKATKSDLVNICRVPEEKVSVIYEAASKDFKYVNYNSALPVLKLVGLVNHFEISPYFLFIGNIEPKKNIKRVLMAFKEFSLQDQLGFKLVIVGDRAWGFESVKDLIREMVDAGILIVTGYLPKQYLPSLLSHARAFLFPSLIEGFGLPILEAMACGCPVITSNISVITEVCGDAAIQVNPQSVPEISQAIALLASNISLCLQLKEKGLIRNQLFSWEKCAQETISVYEEAIAKKHSNIG